MHSNEFKSTLKEFRQQKGLSQKELADLLGTTRDTVANWEHGRGRPNIEMLALIARVFDTSADTLLGVPIRSGESGEIKIKNPDIRAIARAGFTDEEAAKLKKLAEVMFPNAFKRKKNS